MMVECRLNQKVSSFLPFWLRIVGSFFCPPFPCVRVSLDAVTHNVGCHGFLDRPLLSLMQWTPASFEVGQPQFRKRNGNKYRRSSSIQLLLFFATWIAASGFY
jgi:hypothetical protein